MKPGFTIIELMIALALASIIMASLLLFLTQMGTIQSTIDSVSNIYTRAAVLEQLLERELSGAFIPMIPSAAPEKTAGQTAPAAKTPPPPTIEKPFVVVQKDGILATLTFITTNPIIAQVVDNAIKPKMRTARIMYRLQPEKEHKNSYQLMRQEGVDLDVKKYIPEAKDALAPQSVISGIKSCSLTLWAQQEKDGQKNWINSTQWPIEQEGEKTPILLPSLVECTVHLWDDQYKSDQQFIFTFPILGLSTKPQQQEQKKEEKKEEKPGAKPQVPAKATPATPGATPAKPPVTKPPITTENQKVNLGEIIMVVPA